MKKILCMVLSVIMMFILLLPGSASDLELKSDQPFVYPIKPGTEEWQKLSGTLEKRAACNVSKEVLSNMTTKALVETIVTYPLFVDIYAYNSVELGIKALNTYFDGINVLLERKNAVSCLRDYSSKEKIRNEYTDISYYNSDTLLDYLLEKQKMRAKSTIGTEVSKDSGGFDNLFIAIDINDSNENDRTFSPGSAIYTPNGTEVPGYLMCGIHLNRIYDLAWSDHNTTYQAAKAEDIALQNVYSSVTSIAYVNPSYNCHSYAWFSQSPNSYWINDPSVYIWDQSYTATTTVMSGEKVIYLSNDGEILHSGVVNSAGSSITPIRIASKWGYLGTFIHDYNDCPYFGTNVNLYYWE